jgi:MarR family transcriptional regulator, organic hydroperoxide resistance regulator
LREVDENWNQEEISDRHRLTEQVRATYSQGVVMMALWENDGVSVTQLAATTKLGMPTMTPLLKRLEEKKLLQRQAVPTDDRQKRITLTISGQAMATQGAAVAQEAFRRTGLQPAEAQQLLENLVMAESDWLDGPETRTDSDS